MMNSHFVKTGLLSLSLLAAVAGTGLNRAEAARPLPYFSMSCVKTASLATVGGYDYSLTATWSKDYVGYVTFFLDANLNSQLDSSDASRIISGGGRTGSINTIFSAPTAPGIQSFDATQAGASFMDRKGIISSLQIASCS